MPAAAGMTRVERGSAHAGSNVHRPGHPLTEPQGSFTELPQLLPTEPGLVGRSSKRQVRRFGRSINHRDARGRVRLQRATAAARARPSLALHPRAELREAERYRQHPFRVGETTATSSTTNSSVRPGARALLLAKRRCHVLAGRATPWTLIDNHRSPATTPTRKLMSTVSPIETGEQPHPCSAQLARTPGIPHLAANPRRYPGAIASR